MSKAEYRKYAKEIALKRTSNQKPIAKGKKPKIEESWVLNVLEKKEFTAQLMTAEPVNSAQKFQRIGEEVFVSFPYDDITIENLIDACEVKFVDVMECDQTVDILAGERGPSCSRVDQIRISKPMVINFRFIRKDKKKKRASKVSCSVVSSTKNLPEYSLKPNKNRNSFEIPKSVSISQILNMGKLISKTEETPEEIEVGEYKITENGGVWTNLQTHQFNVEKAEIGKGGFRTAYKATCPGLSTTIMNWVVKVFHDETVTEILRYHPTVEIYAKKSVQMHCVAKYYAVKFEEALKSIKPSLKCFKYVPIYFGVKKNKEHEHQIVTIEEFSPGQFRKFINNTGALQENNPLFMQEMAESLAHFSYQKSNKRLILLDIQGCGFNLFDPEIATSISPLDDGNNLLFGVGNLSQSAIDTFFSEHNCNQMCTDLQLEVEMGC